MMRLCGRALWSVVVGLSLVGGAAACGMASLETTGKDSGEPPTNDDNSRSPGPESAGDAPSVIGGTGVILVHAAAFPSFRLCFGSAMADPPVPDTKAMPHANVVGVEIGSVVRVDPIRQAPGDVYVIDEQQARKVIGTNTTRSCAELICTGGSTCLTEGQDYVRAGRIDDPLGTGTVQLLAVTGCGSAALLAAAGTDDASCGSGWDSNKGNVTLKVISLAPSHASNDSAIPAQVVNLSPLLAPAGAGDTVKVGYGELGANAPEVVAATDPRLYELSASTQLPLDPSDEAVYATRGFTVTRHSGSAALDGGAGDEVLAATSLAEVQDLTSPLDVPTTYYRVGSNYVFLLLGDPREKATEPDGGANDAFNIRRGVHILGIPVIDPEALDGGAADGGSAPDPSDGPLDGGSAP